MTCRSDSASCVATFCTHVGRCAAVPPSPSWRRARIACLGLFGIVSYRVARRTSEIKVRLALGATRQGVMRMVLAESAWLLVAGVAVGLVASFFLSRLVSSLR